MAGVRASDAITRRKAVLQLLADEALPLNVSWIYAETGSSLPDLKLAG